MSNDEREKQREKPPIKDHVRREDVIEKMERPAPWPDPPPPPKPKEKNEKEE
jgi:hypothetical protein